MTPDYGNVKIYTQTVWSVVHCHHDAHFTMVARHYRKQSACKYIVGYINNTRTSLKSGSTSVCSNPKYA